MYLLLPLPLPFYGKRKLKFLTTMMFFVLFSSLQLVKLLIFTYTFSPTLLTNTTLFRSRSFWNLQILTLIITRPLATLFKFIRTRLQVLTIMRFVRFTKSPYADAY